jgi:ribosomal protein S7
LEYALEQAWAKRTGPQIGLAQYSGLEHALEERANTLYNTLTPEGRAAAKRLFVSLVKPGEGREDTRARIPAPSDAATQTVIRAFADTEARLVVTDEADGRGSVEVTHEALIRHWKELRGWVDENRDNLRIRDRLRDGRAEWIKHNRDASLLDIPRLHLAEAQKLFKQPGDVRLDDIEDYIEALLEHDRQRQDAEQAKERGELENQQRIAEAEIERKSARRLRRAFFWVAGAGVAALLGFGVSFYYFRQASEQSARAERSANETQRVLDRANRAVAEWINSDLAFEFGKRWAPRTRNALWMLAGADEAVKGDYVAILAGSPSETDRAAPGFGQISRALGLLRPTPDEAKRLFASATNALMTKGGPENSKSLVAEIGALAPKLTEAQVNQALDQVLNAISQTTDPNALLGLAETIRALPVNLSNVQAAQVIDFVLKQTDILDPDTREVIDDAGQALASKLSRAQAGQALDILVKRIGETNDDPFRQAVAEAIQALVPKLTEAQAALALNSVLEQIGQTRHPDALSALGKALEAIAARLTNAQAAEALDLAPKLTDTQASQALDPVLKQIDQMTDTDALQALAEALQALPVKLTDAQAAQALDPVLKQIDQTTHPNALPALAKALQALAPKLTDTQASQALDPILKQIGQTTDTDALSALGKALHAIAARLTNAQAAEALDTILKRFGDTTNPDALQALAEALQALPVKLTDAKAEQALDPVLKQIEQTTDTHALQALAEALQALPVKLTDAKAEQALDPVLKQIDQTTDTHALQALAAALQALAPKLTDTQASQALDPILKQIGQTTDANALGALLKALRLLAPKLAEAQALEVSDRARASLAWAASEEEAAEWARVLVALLDRAGDPDRTQKLVASVAYPAAAGGATVVLLNAIRPPIPLRRQGRARLWNGWPRDTLTFSARRGVRRRCNLMRAPSSNARPRRRKALRAPPVAPNVGNPSVLSTGA